MPLRWKREGQPCPVHVSPDYPRKRTKCRQPVRVDFLLPEPVGEMNGPQGTWECEEGHRGWIWGSDCEEAPE